MDLVLGVDSQGHLSCTLVDRHETATIVAPNASDAAHDLAVAIAEARDGGYAECTWPLAGGEYKWLFRRAEGRIEVVVLWSSGTLTGWQHVFRSAADLTELQRQVAADLGRLNLAGR